MFPSARNTFGRVIRAQRQAQPLVRRIQSSSARARPERPRNGFGLGLGLAAGVGLAGWYEWNTRVVHLDSPERPKPKRVEKDAKFPEEQTPEASSSSSISNAEEFLQHKEDEAIEEAASQLPEASDSEESQGGGGAGGAFNPETGEINWDCPCLGGMAHGPCGQEFRDAFSCFVYSEEEPKGINCVEKFKGMQDCFRRHPEVYGEEIMADDDDEEATEGESLQEPEVVPSSTSEGAPAVPQSSS